MATKTRTIVDQWDEVRQRLRERWEELNQEDLELVRDNVNEVIGRIQARTGETRQDIQRFIDEIITEGGSMAARARDRATELAATAAEAALDGADRAARRATEQFHRAEEMVREHPAPSLLTVFGLGCLAGVLLAWLAKSER
jgi:ElaB/YqjD/DUF883 family membrane-anchored ribosome-binding protein